jgi:Undecaprenyl-phosphate glucose phosphotransferase
MTAERGAASVRITAADEILHTPASRPRRRADWLSPGVVTGMVRAADCGVVLLAGLLAYVTRFGDLAITPLALYSLIVTTLLTLNIFQLAGIYGFTSLGNLYAQGSRLLTAWVGVIFLMLALAFITKTIQDLSRIWVGLWLVYGFVGLVTARVVLKAQLLRWQRVGRLTRNVVVVGAGDHGRRLVEHLRRTDQSVRLIGLFDDRRDRVPDYVAGYPVLGNVDDLLLFARSQPIDQVVVALPGAAEERLLGCIKKLRSLAVDVRLCPDLIGFHLPHRGVTHMAGVPLLNVFEKPLTGWDCVVKAIEDRVLAGLILLLIAPLMLAIAIAIKATSKGPVFFRQQRYGFNNEVIDVFKFRSMYQDASGARDDSEVAQAKRNDRRITRLGRILRRTSLDELPQFFNVLKGDMSIVGPRPHAVAHNEQYARVIDEYLARHRVRPGITGWAQVNGLRGETETVEKMEKRVQHDLYYIENWSLGFDLRIILMTLLVGFTDPNAY